MQHITFVIILIRQFAPNVSEVSDEFQRLAVQFQNGGIFEYAGLCYLGASKCEKAINNVIFEIHLLLKAARAFIEADADKLALRSNGKLHLQGALDCYYIALAKLDDVSPIKAAIIREMKKIHPDCDQTSNFVSPAHRAHDLDLAATECIKSGTFEAAFDKLTELCDDIAERKVEHLYTEILRKHYITIILLIILLDLPSARQSPSHIDLFRYFSSGGIAGSLQISYSESMLRGIQSLVNAFHCRQYALLVNSEIPSFQQLPHLTLCHKIILEKLKAKYYSMRFDLAH